MKSIHVIVKGRVQGVAFRYHTKRKANDLGIKGTVQNKKDGSVEIFATGDFDTIQYFLEWLHIGSPASQVTELYIEHFQSQSDRDNAFDIIR
jgi:acylphosphatase